MMNRKTWENGTKIIKISLAAVAVFLGMKFVFPILLPFFIAFIIAQLLHPLAEKIEKKNKAEKDNGMCPYVFAVSAFAVWGSGGTLLFVL